MNARRKWKPKRPVEDRQNILDKIEQFALENPDLTRYNIRTGREGREILLALAALLAGWSGDPSVKQDKDGRAKIRKYAQEYRKAAIRSESLAYISGLGPDDQIVIAGLLVTVIPPKRSRWSLFQWLFEYFRNHL